jgi:hypothetical protein
MVEADYTMMDFAAEAGLSNIIDFVLEWSPLLHGNSRRIRMSGVRHLCNGHEIVLEIIYRLMATGVFDINYRSPTDEMF